MRARPGPPPTEISISTRFCRIARWARRRAARPPAGSPPRSSSAPRLRRPARGGERGPPAAPIACTTRPQFGSPPKSAVLTSAEFATERATRSASRSLRAPRTATVASLVTPSPSRARRSQSSALASSSRRSNSRARREPTPIGVLPAAPLASTSTVSLVLVSPSMVSALKVASAAPRSARRRSAGSTARSVARYASIVAMRGMIMPAPFAIPASAKPRPRRWTSFATVSVVRIASAARSKPRGESASTARGMPSRRRSIGRSRPITPVDATWTSRARAPISRATRAVISRASRRPRAPLATFEIPLFTTTPRARAPRMCARDTTTGAPGKRLVVNTAAATAGESETISARSGRPLGLMPQAIPAARKPRTSIATPVLRFRRRPRLGPGAVTLLVFLARAARTRVVAADFGTLAHDRLRRDRRVRRRAAVLLVQALLLRGPARLLDGAHLPDPLRRRQFDHHAKHLLDGARADAPEHLAEQLEALGLIHALRVLARVALQPDAFLQVVHREQVVLPELVERLEQDAARHPFEGGRVEVGVALRDVREHLDLLVEPRVDSREQLLEHNLAVRVVALDLRRGRLDDDRELRLNLARVALDVGLGLRRGRDRPDLPRPPLRAPLALPAHGAA